MTLDRHHEELMKNRQVWHTKPLLRRVYQSFYEEIQSQLRKELDGPIVELGSGVCGIKSVIPECVCTDLFPGPEIDRVESVYALSFADASVANLILFDVFHHLQYPGTALAEMRRVLKPSGRIILFEPCVSLLGMLVYGLGHREPVALGKTIEPFAPARWTPADSQYYAAQGNAYRIFVRREIPSLVEKWSVITVKRLSAFAYVTSGGYQRWQLYPTSLWPAMNMLDRLLTLAPAVFATRLLVVLEN